NYDEQKGFSISQQFMKDNDLNHSDMTNKQRELFKELFESGRPNTLEEHTRIAREALKAGGADDDMIEDLIAKSLENLSSQGVTQPTRIPWYTKLGGKK
ncbi:MAG: hemagglutinin, partial [Lachnospiraceae bacterium]|nr:hemagglutinin [Lachnospiraceae bacterium]